MPDELKDDTGIVRHKVLHFSPFVDRGELFYRVTPGITRIEGNGEKTDIMRESLGRAIKPGQFLIVQIKDDGRLHLETVEAALVPLSVRRFFK